MINLNDYPYKITIKKWKDESEEYFIAEVPELKGCMSDGVTIKETLKNIKDAMVGYIEVKKEFGDLLPKPQNDQLIIEIQGEFSEEEKNECYQALEKMKKLIEDIGEKR